jgi:predicted outer membrane lipoprotein
MEDRIAKLEEFAVEARERLNQTATKADLRELETTMIKWLIGTLLAVSVAAITVMTFVLNNAVPKPPMAAPAAPVVIYLPQPPSQK